MDLLNEKTHRSILQRVDTVRATLEWAGDTYGNGLCLLASMQDAVLVDLAMAAIPDVDVVFLDTGYHFAETHQTLHRIESRYDIDVKVVGPPQLLPWPVLPGECCAPKIQLLDEALQGRSAWLTGARRCEASSRSNLRRIGTDRRGLAKISPLAEWSDQDVARYVETHAVITNPLIAQGYASIGCEPCTTKADYGDPRSGRWRGTGRTECGIHL